MSLNKTLLPILLAFAIYSCSQAPEKEVVDETPRIGSLIEVNILQRIKDADSVKIIDLRKPEVYSENHIPGAINIWRSDVEDDSISYDGMIASKAKVEALLGRLGIQSTDFLIIYDDNASCDAAHLWWVLDHYRFTQTALLNGGLKAWSKVAHLTTKVPDYPATSFSFPPSQPSNRIVLMNDLVKEMKDSSLVIIDARTIEEFRGEYIKKGAFDKGRIPKSIHVEWVKSMNYDEQTFISKEELKKLFISHGVDSTTNVVSYCHSGVRSAHSLFVLTQLLGYETIRNYDGSWVEWSYNKLPFERENQNIN